MAEGQQVDVELLDAEEGGEVALDPGARRRRRHRARHARRSSTGASVTGKVVGTAKGPKINGFTYKRRTNQRRRYGHRQQYTVVEITSITEGLRRPSHVEDQGWRFHPQRP